MKSYLEMGLPVVMTRISGIVPYIEQFKAGEVIDSLTELSFAVDRINKNPDTYLTGVRLFSEYFRYDKYYADKLSITVK